MGSIRRDKGDSDKSATCSISATWRAIRFLPSDHFPLILPGVYPVASFFILKRLKRLGYSSCKVTTSDKGLVVHAHK
jgi:hypothetical protein